MPKSLRYSSISLAIVALALALPSTAAQASTSASAGSAPADSSTCGGETPVKANGDPWICTFDDEFDGTSLNTNNWTVQVTATSGYHSGIECFVNDPSNVSVSNGTLNLTVHATPAPFTCPTRSGGYKTQYTSGMVSSPTTFSQTYGRFEVRAKLPATAIAGLQETFWLWPENSTMYGPKWPASGEIDFAEFYSKYANRSIPYVHYIPAGFDLNMTNNYCMITDLSEFHTYAVEWTPDTITAIYDGNKCIVDTWKPWGLTKPAPFNQPFFIALTQALGIGKNLFNPATTPLPATTQVDYVRAWQ